jgi:hypothetical protein
MVKVHGMGALRATIEIRGDIVKTDTLAKWEALD